MYLLTLVTIFSNRHPFFFFPFSPPPSLFSPHIRINLQYLGYISNIVLYKLDM